MNGIAKYTAAFAVAFTSLAAAAPASAQITAQVKTTMNVLGILALGSENAKAQFETAAKAAGFSTAHSKSISGQDEVMLITSTKDAPASLWALYHAALAGKYGPLKVEVILVPTDADPDAKDYLDHAQIYESAQVYEPKN